MKSELFYRIVSAVILVPALAFIGWAGGIYYFLLIELCIGVGAYEFFKILKQRGLKPYITVGVVAALILGWNAYFASHIFTFLTFTLLFFFISISELYRKNLDHAIYHISGTIFGAFYLGWLMSHLVLLRQIPAFLHHPSMIRNLQNLKLYYFFPNEMFGADYSRGILYTLIPFVLAWVNDTGAYFIGSKFGRHKILERVSPGKSWEGFVGGGICAMIGIFILKIGWAPWLKVIDCIVLSILGALLAPMGDFVESLLKRDANIKNAGTTIPGHGGILDRFDSVLFVAPMVYYYLRFFVIK
ncbi:phosphatidate cytidylyltransferase [candidate division WOR-3 bacterium]|nr:phosphatidate cytidylyltransferase [candidate division WOR-3 bacterium]